MLSKVKRPDSTEVTFKYDALGRRIKKRFNRTVTHWIWDGNVPLHEWREIHTQDYEPDKGYFTNIEKLPVTTWLFEEGTFIPAAKLTANKNLKIEKVRSLLCHPLNLMDGDIRCREERMYQFQSFSNLAKHQV